MIQALKEKKKFNIGFRNQIYFHKSFETAKLTRAFFFLIPY